MCTSPESPPARHPPDPWADSIFFLLSYRLLYPFHAPRHDRSTLILPCRCDQYVHNFIPRNAEPTPPSLYSTTRRIIFYLDTTNIGRTHGAWDYDSWARIVTLWNLIGCVYLYSCAFSPTHFFTIVFCLLFFYRPGTYYFFSHIHIIHIRCSSTPRSHTVSGSAMSFRIFLNYGNGPMNGRITKLQHFGDYSKKKSCQKFFFFNWAPRALLKNNIRGINRSSSYLFLAHCLIFGFFPSVYWFRECVFVIASHWNIRWRKGDV